VAKADIQLAVKGLRELRSLNIHLDRNSAAIDRSLEKIMKYNSVTRSHFVPTLNNLSSALAKAQANFDKSNISTVQGIKAAENLANAQAKVNAELLERNNLLKTVGPRGQAFGPQQATSTQKEITQTQQAKDLVQLNESLAALENRSLDNIAKKVQLKNEEISKGQALVRIEKQRAVSPKFGSGGSRGSTIKSLDLTGFAAFSKRATEIQKTTKAEQKLTRSRQLSIEKTKSLESQERRRRKSQSFGANLRRARRGRTQDDLDIRNKALSNALIGGAFPLLFGQGPLAAAGGALGGGAGGILGGQFGFALSLVGTQIGSAISQLVSGAAELGKAIGPFTQDTKAVTSALGLQGSAQEKQLQLIEQVEGKTQAFNAATGLLARKIGQNGVTALQEFGESSRLLSSAFSVALVRLQAFSAGILDFILKITGAKDGLAKGEANDLIDFAATRGNTEALALIQEQKRINAIPDKLVGSSGGILGGPIPVQTEEAKNAQKILDRNKRILAIKLKEKTAQGDITVESDLKLKKLREENDLQERIKENSKIMTKDLAEKVSKLEQEFDLRTKTLKEVKKFRAKEMQDLATQVLLDGKISENEKIQLENAEAKFVAIGELLDENNLKKAEGVELVKDLHTEADKVKDAFESLGLEILDSVKDGIKGLIKGTSTLSDLLNNVADKFLDVALNQALFGSILGSKGEKGGGIFGALGLFADGGRPPVNRPSIVGEKGPELFVPRSSGNIIPNNKLGGGNTNNIVVNVDASGSDVQGDDAAAKELGSLISVAVQGELLKQQRPGGLLSR